MKKKTSLLSMLLIGAFVFGNTYGINAMKDVAGGEQGFGGPARTLGSDMPRLITDPEIRDLDAALIRYRTEALDYKQEAGQQAQTIGILRKQQAQMIDMLRERVASALARREAQIAAEQAISLKKESLEQDADGLSKDISSLKGKIQDNENAMAQLNQSVASDKTVYDGLKDEKLELEAQAGQKLIEYSNNLDALTQAREEHDKLLAKIKAVDIEIDRNCLAIADVVKNTPKGITAKLEGQKAEILTRLTDLMQKLQKENGVIHALREKNKKDMNDLNAFGKKLKVNQNQGSEALGKEQAALQERYNQTQTISSEERKLTLEEQARMSDEAALDNMNESSEPSKPSGSILRKPEPGVTKPVARKPEPGVAKPVAIRELSGVTPYWNKASKSERDSDALRVK